MEQKKSFLLTAPSGCGKSVLSETLLRAFPEKLERVITCTTRKPRPGERHGVDYYFMSDETFLTKQQQGDFFESAGIYGKYYGSAHAEVQRIIERGKHPLFIVDIQGAYTIASCFPRTILISLEPPSLPALRDRLMKRQSDSPSVIQMRLAFAAEELRHAGLCHYRIVNDSLSVAEYELAQTVASELACEDMPYRPGKYLSFTKT